MIIKLIKKVINVLIDFINYCLPYEIPKLVGDDIFYECNCNAEAIVVPNELIKETFKEISKGGVRNVYITKRY